MPADDPTGLRFGEAAAAYERGRPEYPAALVGWLLPAAPRLVIDLGAGTGKLTRALVGLVGPAATVVGVEPDPQMRRMLGAQVPGVEVRAGDGEHLPLGDGVADAVLAGQAWHWVDADRAAPEVARVLRPGGVLGLIWNHRDEQDVWVAALGELLLEFGTSPDAGYVPRAGVPFGSLERRELRWTHRVPVDAVVDMVASRSYVIALDPDRRERLLARVRAHAAARVDPLDDLVPVPYVTRAYRAVRP